MNPAIDRHARLSALLQPDEAVSFLREAVAREIVTGNEGNFAAGLEEGHVLVRPQAALAVRVACYDKCWAAQRG